MKKVKVDSDVCIGCGLCVSLYPELFELGEDGHSRIKKGVKIDEEKLKKTMKLCPSNAIYEEVDEA